MLFEAQRAVEVARGRAAVDEEGRARDERALVAHQKLGDVCDFVRRAGASRGALSEHVLVEAAARAVELVECQRRDDDAGAMSFRRAPRSPHSTACAVMRFSLQRFAI